MTPIRTCAVALSAVLLFAAPVPAQQRAAPAIDTLAIRAHTRFLADDALRGRGTGTRGERIAAAYIASRLHGLGLAPLGSDTSYLLPIPLRTVRIGPATRANIIAAGDSAAFASGPDFVVNTGGDGAFRDFHGNAVFFGQPAHAARLVRAERSLAGRVAVFLGPLGADALDIIPALRDAGAAGVVLLVPDPPQYDLYVRSRGDARFFVAADVEDPVWQPQIPVIIAGPRMTDALLAGAAVPRELVEGMAARGHDLERAVAVTIQAHVEDVPAANVGALLRGSDPARADELIVYTAHFDHLGVSAPDAAGDSIYNGFSDNAAGVAMLLAIAESLRHAPPARSVAFLFFTGEERGLLGSSHLASAPPLPLARVRALINLDAGAPPAPPVSWRIAGGEGSPLGDVARRTAERNGWTAALSAASPNSDYWPFLQRGVPSIFIIPGGDWENTSPEQRDALRARWDRYHRADDHWHAEFPFAGLKRYAEYALLVGLDVADQPR